MASPPIQRDRRTLRVQVDDSHGGRRKVNVMLPMRLVNAGLKIANHYLDEETSEHAAALYEAIRNRRDRQDRRGLRR